MDKRYLKKEGEELQQYLTFRKKGGKVNGKKGRCPYKRKAKHQKREEW